MAYVKSYTRLCENPDCTTTGERRKHYGNGLCENCWKVVNNERKRPRGERVYRGHYRTKQINDELGYSSTERTKDHNLRKGFGISLAEYRALPQDCGICGASDPGRTGTNYLPVDHCHETGKVRGVLCANCNTALGLLKDDSRRIWALLNYIMSIPK